MFPSHPFFFATYFATPQPVLTETTSSFPLNFPCPCSLPHPLSIRAISRQRSARYNRFGLISVNCRHPEFSGASEPPRASRAVDAVVVSAIKLSPFRPSQPVALPKPPDEGRSVRFIVALKLSLGFSLPLILHL